MDDALIGALDVPSVPDDVARVLVSDGIISVERSPSVVTVKDLLNFM